MKFIIQRESLLKPLQQVSVSFGNRYILPILGNLLLQVRNNTLSITGTDLEIEIMTHVVLVREHEVGITTVPARKFFDIFRTLPEGSEITITMQNNHVLICSGRSRFLLATLPAKNFPNLNNWQNEIEFSLAQKSMKYLIETTQFSMARQDVRYCLNGMLFETEGRVMRTVTTDGHRLAMCSISIDTRLPKYSVIMPRKGIVELIRLIDNCEELLLVQIGRNNIRIHISDYCMFTSKLIDGRFPDYRHVFQKKPNIVLELDRNVLKQAFLRVAIISNEKFCSVRLYISHNQLKIVSNNPDQEEAEEILDITYTGISMEIVLNVKYLLDVLNVLKCKNIRIFFIDAESSVKIEDAISKNVSYIIMPIRI